MSFEVANARFQELQQLVLLCNHLSLQRMLLFINDKRRVFGFNKMFQEYQQQLSQSSAITSGTNSS